MDIARSRSARRESLRQISSKSRKEFLVSEYLYARGQHVTFTAKRFFGLWSGAFVVTKLLPSGGEEPRYEIKGIGENFSRAALESQLSARLELSQSGGL